MSILNKSYRADMFEVRHLVDEEHEGIRLDQFLQLYLDSFSRESIKKKIKEKEITIVSRPGTHKPSSILHHKDEVVIRFFKSIYEDEYWRGEKLTLQTAPDIVFEDDDLIVISKPAFMSTHPAGRHVFNCATVFFEMLYEKTIHSLHRIDRETSGILMLGKNPKMANEMMLHFEKDDVKKCYLFISKANSHYKGQTQFVANERMGSPDEGLKRVYVESYPEHSLEGKQARTYFTILEQVNDYVIGLASPETGRQHQIRVHALAHGIPLIGDKLYLGSYEMFQRFKDQVAGPEDHDLMELPRHALHAIALRIPYKKEKEKLFLTKIPQDLKEWIQKKTPLDINELERKISQAVNRYYEFVDKKN
ncbi:MAG: RluA family pseudouridine synthase [Bacteriovorax sp.]|nr:RluA family pseudouridine synthase [Bacteriovorax sp.]